MCGAGLLRGLDVEAFSGCRDGIAERRRRRALPRLDAPQSLLERRSLLQVHAVEEIDPAVRSRVDEQLELRAQRQLIFRSEQRDLAPAVRSQWHLETSARVADVGKRDGLAL